MSTRSDSLGLVRVMIFLSGKRKVMSVAALSYLETISVSTNHLMLSKMSSLLLSSCNLISDKNDFILACYKSWDLTKLEKVLTIAARAFDILFIGCVLNTKIAYTNARNVSFSTRYSGQFTFSTSPQFL